MINDINFKIYNKTNQKLNIDYIKNKIKEITAKFNIKTLNKPIKIYVYENAEECGKAYGEDDPSPCNGFTKLPNEIHIINSNTLILHELTHIIMYLAFGKSSYAFIREGFAEFFQEEYNSESYDKLIKELSLKDFKNYLDNENFYKENPNTVYPLAGVFIKKLVSLLGIEKALNMYKLSIENNNEFLEFIKQINFN